MMVNTKFEAYKLRRELARSGRNFTFMRMEPNRFGESLGDPQPVGSVTGLYHEQNSNILITSSDAAQVRTKKSPMILCLYDDVAPLELQAGDIVTINGREFKATGVVDIQEWSIIADISLELVDNANED